MTRYLIVAADAAVAPTQALVDTHKGARPYEVVSLAVARNGMLDKLDGQEVLCWPDASGVDEMRQFAAGLALICKKVKDINVEGAALTVDAMRDASWDWARARKYFKDENRIREVAPPDKLDVAAQQEAQDNAGSPPGSPAGAEERSDAAADPVPVPDSAAGEPAPLFEIPPPEAYEEAQSRPVASIPAERAYEPYRSHADAAGGQETWPEPLDLAKSLYRGLPLPMALVPDALRPLILDCFTRTGIDAGAYFMGFLGAISGLANDFLTLQPKQLDHTWRVRPVVWPIAIGDTGTGKTTALEEGMNWVRAKDRAAVLENERKRKDFKHQWDIYEDECAVARKNKLSRPQEPEPPVLREYWVSRGTTEGVTRLLEHSPKVTWYMDEFSGLCNSWDAYKNTKGSGDREYVLQLFNGGPGKTVLAGKTISLANASAVLCGGSTPVAMRGCAGGKLMSDGFLQRTLLCMVPRKGDGVDAVPDQSAIDGYDRLLDNILEMPGNATVKLSADAATIYADFCLRLNGIIAAEDHEPLKNHYSKWYGTAGRLMLIYAIVEAARHEQYLSDGSRVSGEIAQQCCSLLLDWQVSHCQAFYLELMADKAGRSFSQAIARYILANPDLATLNFRDHVSRPHWSAIEKLKPWEIKEAINTLINAAWLSPVGLKMNTYGVPAAYDINPKLRDSFDDQREREIERRSAARDELQAMRREVGAD